jgi:general secretion pathway protein F
MQFTIRALGANQELRTLTFDAADEDDARRQLQAQRLEPLSVQRVSAWSPHRTRPFPLHLFAQELLGLLTAGLSVIEALETLLEKDPDPARARVLGRLAQDLREGLRLSAALRHQPEAFPALFVGLVQAAEVTSDLPRALGRYLDYETRVHTVRHKVTSAAIYPAVLLVVGGAVSLFLLGYVVPRFAAVYQGSGRDLPWASQLLMAWGALVAQHAALLAVVALALLSVAAWRMRRALRSGGWTRLLSNVPGAREKLQVLMLSRLYLTLGMLLEGGIALPQALRLSEAASDAATVRALQSVRHQIESGQPLSVAFAQQGLGTPVANRLLRVGEQSGQLGTMLVRTALLYEEETSRWIDRFTKVFEPVLMAAIGLVIGVIVVLLYLPIFELAGSFR